MALFFFCALKPGGESGINYKSPRVIIAGKIAPGASVGAYYVKQYSEAIADKLNFVPYPGTLNIKPVGSRDLKREFPLYLNYIKKSLNEKDCTFFDPDWEKFDIANLKEIKQDIYSIKPFKKDGNFFGSVILIPIKLHIFHGSKAPGAGGEIHDCFIVIPEKAQNREIVEILSGLNLKKEFNLKTGDSVLIFI